jgi:hypothetical protein
LSSLMLAKLPGQQEGQDTDGPQSQDRPDLRSVEGLTTDICPLCWHTYVEKSPKREKVTKSRKSC